MLIFKPPQICQEAHNHYHKSVLNNWLIKGFNSNREILSTSHMPGAVHGARPTGYSKDKIENLRELSSGRIMEH